MSDVYKVSFVCQCVFGSRSQVARGGGRHLCMGDMCPLDVSTTGKARSEGFASHRRLLVAHCRCRQNIVDEAGHISKATKRKKVGREHEKNTKRPEIQKKQKKTSDEFMLKFVGDEFYEFRVSVLFRDII